MKEKNVVRIAKAGRKKKESFSNFTEEGGKRGYQPEKKYFFNRGEGGGKFLEGGKRKGSTLPRFLQKEEH